MNSVSADFEYFIECDDNPFILFDSNGKIIYLNNAAGILMGHVTPQELYDITVSYAPKDFGYKTTRLELQYDIFSFYAITVAYNNEEQIGLRLYYKPRVESMTLNNFDKLPPTDLNTMLEANITLFKLDNKNTIELLADQDLPPCRIDQNSFSKLLRKSLYSFRDAEPIKISLKLMLGEYVLVNNEQERIIQFAISSPSRDLANDDEIKSIAQNINISCILKKNSITLHIPFIQ